MYVASGTAAARFVVCCFASLLRTERLSCQRSDGWICHRVDIRALCQGGPTLSV